MADVYPASFQPSYHSYGDSTQRPCRSPSPFGSCSTQPSVDQATKEKVTSLVNTLMTDPGFAVEYARQLSEREAEQTQTGYTDMTPSSSGTSTIRYPRIPVSMSGQEASDSRFSDASAATIRPPYYMSGALGPSDPTSLIDSDVDDCVYTKRQAPKPLKSCLKKSRSFATNESPRSLDRTRSMPDMSRSPHWTDNHSDSTAKQPSRQPQLRRSRSCVETSDWEKQKLAAEILDTLGDQSVDRVAQIMERLDYDSDLRSMATAVGGQGLAEHMMLEEHYRAAKGKAGPRSRGLQSMTATRPQSNRDRNATAPTRRRPRFS